MSANDNWPASLGSPDFTVTPDWPVGGSGPRTVQYWLCGDVPEGVREEARHVENMLQGNDASTMDESAFTALASQLSELDLQGRVCSAVYDASDAAWYPLKRCAIHALPNAGPYYLILELGTPPGARPEVLPFGARHLAEQALSNIGSTVGENVSLTNEQGAVLRVRRDSIVDARVSTTCPPDPPHSR